MTTVLNARNAEYASASKGAIRCDVLFDDALNEKGERVWLPFTTTASHPDSYARQLYTDLASGMYGDIKPFVVTPLMIKSERSRKYDLINEWRDKQEGRRAQVSYLDRWWDADKETLERLDAVCAMIKAGSELPQGFFWTDAANTDVPLTAEQLRGLKAAVQQKLVEWGFKIHARQRAMKKEVSELTNLTDIENYFPSWSEPDKQLQPQPQAQQQAEQTAEPQPQTEPQAPAQPQAEDDWLAGLTGSLNITQANAIIRDNGADSENQSH